jgi:hypothetical protein
MHTSVSTTVTPPVPGNFLCSLYFNAACFIKMPSYCFKELAIIILKAEYMFGRKNEKLKSKGSEYKNHHNYNHHCYYYYYYYYHYSGFTPV